MIKCEICGEEFNNITWKHLAKHSVTLKEYMELFPHALITSPETAERKRLGATKSNKSRIGIPRSKDTRDKISQSKQNNHSTAWNKGVPRTLEQNIQLSETRKRKFESGELVHWNTGHTTTAKTKTKISTALISKQLTFTLESKQKRQQTIQDKINNGWVHHSSLKITKETKQYLKNKQWLEEQHFVLHKTLQEIADDLQVDHTTVHRHFQKLDIKPQRFASSAAEQEIVDFLKSHQISNIVSNTRDIITPKELDIFLPDHNVAIEYCGLYWHSHYHKPKNYHVDKLNECTKLGIRLVTIFEDEWLHERHKVEQKLLSVLGKDGRSVVYARKCDIRPVSIQTKRQFFKDNHIQGDGPGSINYGLYHEETLVAVMSFIHQKGQHILNRYATSHRVIGGSSKLLKHFKKSNKWTEIVSFADRRWSDGNLYNTTGWSLDKVLVPDYYYVVNTRRVHKFNYRRKKLPLLLENFDPSLSETDNTSSAGIPRIYNCGLLRYKMKNIA